MFPLDMNINGRQRSGSLRRSVKIVIGLPGEVGGQIVVNRMIGNPRRSAHRLSRNRGLRVRKRFDMNSEG